MRGVAFVIVAVVLGACRTRDPYVVAPATTTSGNWQIEKQVDRVTGVPAPSAIVMTRNASNSYAEDPGNASLQLTCFDAQPMVRISFPFKVGSDTNSIFGYRFDEKPGHDNVNVRFLQQYKTVVIEDKTEIMKFVNELAGSDVLLMRIRSINAGRTTAEFKLDGAQAAIEAGFAGCPLTPPAAPKPDTKKKRGAKV
ncbi:MAG: hypothetical protein ACRC9K_18950 [Afipia sp.]